MNEEQNEKKKRANGLFKTSKKTIILIFVVIGFIAFALISSYIKLKDDFAKLSQITASYSIAYNEYGQLSYSINSTGSSVPIDDEEQVDIIIGEIAGDLEGVLRDYIDGDDEYYQEVVRYLLEADAVTRLPYIGSSDEAEDGEAEAETEEEESTLQGTIKFYRYQNDAQASDAYKEDGTLNDAYMMQYTTPEDFQAKKGTAEISKYFTIDETGQVIIATTKEEIRTITTGDEAQGIAPDKDLTVEMINENENATTTYEENGEGGFSAYEFDSTDFPIDYMSLVENYVMPMNLLYALLIQTKDVDLVLDIASLAYQNEIAVAIYDNESVNVTNQTYTYKKDLTIDTKVNLDFSHIQTTNPEISSDILRRSTSYSNIPYRCIGTMTQGRAANEDGTFPRGNAHHQVYYYSQTNGEPRTSTPIDLYIGGVNDNNEITSLADWANAETFIAKYYKKITSKFNPTIGVVVADTWIARWEATYSKADPEDIPTITSNGTRDGGVIKAYTSTEGFLSIFDTNMQNEINSRLQDHAVQLKEDAVAKILDQTEFDVEVEDVTEITYNNLSLSQKAQILREHTISCTDCGLTIVEWWIDENGSDTSNIVDWERAVNEITGSGGALRWKDDPTYGRANSDIYGCFMDELQDYADDVNRAAQREAEREAQNEINELKENMTNELNEQITYTAEITGKKFILNVVFDETKSRTTSKYKKDNTSEVDKIGEKFAKVFNDTKYIESKEAILYRMEWFWEYIRENEDTAVLEDVLRYLLNVVTGTENFGTFSDKDLEKIFRDFEPKTITLGVTHTYAFTEWLKSYENNDLRRYMNEDEEILYEAVKQYVTEDRKFGKMYFTESDGCWNFTYGIMVYSSEGEYKNLDIFEEYEIDLVSLVQLAQEQKANGEEITVTVPMEKLESIYNELIFRKYRLLKASISEYAQDKGIENKFETWQYYALVNFCYQWENCGEKLEGENNIVEVFEKYYEDNPENFRTNAVLVNSEGELVNFFDVRYKDKDRDRQEAAWIMFTEGRYILNGGEEIFVSGSFAELILDACIEVTNELIINEVHYYTDGNGYALYWNDIEKSSDYSSGVGTCCATYVGSVLYKAGIFTEDYINKYNYNLPGCPTDRSSIYGMLYDAGWQIIDPLEAQPGDIATFCEHNYVKANGEVVDRQDHAYIYAGGNLVWDQATGCISGDNTPSGKPLATWNTYLNLYNVTVFRAP